MRRLLLVLILLAGCTAAPTPPPPLPTLAPLPDEVRTIFFWETASSQFDTAESVDFWQFGAQAGDNIFIRAVTRTAELRLTLLLGETLVISGDSSLEVTLPATGLYRVRVDAVNGIGAYDIGIGYTDRPNPNRITQTPLPQVVGVPTPTPPFNSLGEFITRMDESRDYAEILSAQSPEHIYTIDGTAGQFVTFELFRIAGTFDPVLRFFDADSNLIAMDDDSLGDGNARLLNLQLPEDGLYSVQVSGKGLFGDYTLVYINEIVLVQPDALPTVSATEIIPYETPMIRFAAPEQRLDDHVPALNSIRRAGDFQRFSFFVEAGERISMVVEPLDGSTIVPQFEIFDPDGSQVAIASARDPNTNGAAAANGIIAQTGAHIVIVTAEDNTTGQFLVSFGRGATVRDDYQGFAFPDSPVSAVLDRVGSRHIWELDLNPGDVISVAVSPETTTFDPVIELATASGEVLAVDDDGGVGDAALFRSLTITRPAAYLLRVYDESGLSTGSYTIAWGYVSTAPTPTPVPAQANLLVVNDAVPEGQYQFYAFQGRIGQTLRIEAIAESTTVLDPVIALLDPTGDIILEADDNNGSLNPQATITLPEDGTYQVRINGYLSGGAFTLSVSQLID